MFWCSLPAPVLAVYESGPTGFGLTWAAIERDLERTPMTKTTKGSSVTIGRVDSTPGP